MLCNPLYLKKKNPIYIQFGSDSEMWPVQTYCASLNVWMVCLQPRLTDIQKINKSINHIAIILKDTAILPDFSSAWGWVDNDWIWVSIEGFCSLLLWGEDIFTINPATIK